MTILNRLSSTHLTSTLPGHFGLNKEMTTHGNYATTIPNLGLAMKKKMQLGRVVWFMNARTFG